MLRVTTSTGDGSFKCRFEYGELLSFDEKPLPLRELKADQGGVSGGPVFGVENINYPFIGVVMERSVGYEDTGVIVIEAVEGVPSTLDA